MPVYHAAVAKLERKAAPRPRNINWKTTGEDREVQILSTYFNSQNEDFEQHMLINAMRNLKRNLLESWMLVLCLEASEMFLQLQHHHLLANIRARDWGGGCSNPQDGVSPGTPTCPDTKYVNVSYELI